MRASPSDDVRLLLSVTRVSLDEVEFLPLIKRITVQCKTYKVCWHDLKCLVDKYIGLDLFLRIVRVF